jgi:hypothetical protein
MNSLDLFNKLVNTIKTIQQDVTELDNNIVNGDATSLSNAVVNYKDNLSGKWYTFTFDGTRYSYKEFSATNFYKTDNNFGAAEICNLYIYSPKGIEPSNYGDLDSSQLFTNTHIMFTTWNYNKDKTVESVRSSVNRNYNISNCDIEKTENSKSFYVAKAETVQSYLESYFFETKGLYEDELTPHTNHFQISLFINKQAHKSKSEMLPILSEFKAIINTLTYEPVD